MYLYIKVVELQYRALTITNHNIEECNLIRTDDRIVAVRRSNIITMSVISTCSAIVTGKGIVHDVNVY